MCARDLPYDLLKRPNDPKRGPAHFFLFALLSYVIARGEGEDVDGRSGGGEELSDTSVWGGEDL